MWSSAAITHLPQGLMCCMVRDVLLYTLVVMSGHLSPCPSVRSNQFDHSDLTRFSPTELLLIGCFSFSLSVNPRDGFG